ncbi:MAG: iron ABC transporter permease [Clostridia bacterium]|nr:iron ABC transporter permease [Clostridia bacterium]
MELHDKNKSTINLSDTGRFAVVMFILAGLLCWGLVLNVNIGSVYISVGNIFSMIWDSVRYGIANVFSGGKYAQEFISITDVSVESRIIFGIRIPRMLLAAILGGGLSVSGFLLQTFFRNPIAGPFVLGISSGAKMVVGITLVFLTRHIGYMGTETLIISSFAGSLLITSIVLLFAGRVKNMSMLLVIGIMVGYICNAVTDFLITFANDHDILNLTGWSMGTFSGASWSNVKTAAVLCFSGLLASWLLSKPMGVYALGEGYASSMGLNVRPFRVILILLSSLLSSCVTALAGPVSFVGIAVPHITRTLLKSSRPAFVIPASFICGAVFCVFCDLIARTVFAPTELAIGTVTSVFGAPVVIYIMVKRRRSQED